MLAEGRIEDAFCKIGPVWASMPCNDYGQPQKAASALVAKYNEALQKYQAIAHTSTSNEGWINPAPGATFTSGFGYRVHPLKQYRSCHYGIDLAGPTGTPILAAKGGLVEEAGWNNGGFGNLVILKHDDGSQTLYAHNSELKVSAGQRVSQGDVIALMGSTGNSTGPHIHFEMDLGQGKVDPRPHIPGISGNQTFGKIDPQATQTECRGRAL
ncbi:M23 family metallopeptidase [Leptolyngbya sp. FACHB-8]|nr:M23 family metallopeptidase [Leptolyngbya sp. FACHB-8]